jgi:hypothetical protein
MFQGRTVKQIFESKLVGSRKRDGTVMRCLEDVEKHQREIKV